MIVYHGSTEIIKKPDDMAAHDSLEAVYKQNLENDIIKYLADAKQIELRCAFDIYYSSRLAEQIARGENGIENLDAKYLSEDLMENEKELFE